MEASYCSSSRKKYGLYSTRTKKQGAIRFHKSQSQAEARIDVDKFNIHHAPNDVHKLGLQIYCNLKHGVKT